MLKLGKFNKLTVVKKVNFGIYLKVDNLEILMPSKWVPDNVNIGDELEVFVYRDSDDRLIATTITPYVTADSFAFLEVRDVNDTGAFLDWGMEKDLLLPFREQQKRVYPNSGCVVYVFVDEETNRLVASTKLKKFIQHDDVDVKIGEAVDLLIYAETNLGYSAIVNNKFSGLIYKNEVYDDIRIGDRLTGYIKNIREDNKIDLSIQKLGYEKIADVKDLILQALRKNKGYIAVNDSTSPEEIKSLFQMSKKTFKKTIGALYKERLIEIKDKGIKLLVKN